MSEATGSSSENDFPEHIKQMRLGEFLASVHFDWEAFSQAVQELEISGLQRNLILMGKETHIGNFLGETRNHVLEALKRLKKQRERVSAQTATVRAAVPPSNELKSGMSLCSLMQAAQISKKDIELVLYALDVLPSTINLILMMSNFELIRLEDGHIRTEIFRLLDVLHTRPLQPLLALGKQKKSSQHSDKSLTRTIKRMKAVGDGKSTTTLHREDVGLPEVDLE